MLRLEESVRGEFAEKAAEIGSQQIRKVCEWWQFDNKKNMHIKKNKKNNTSGFWFEFWFCFLRVEYGNVAQHGSRYRFMKCFNWFLLFFQVGVPCVTSLPIPGVSSLPFVTFFLRFLVSLCGFAWPWPQLPLRLPSCQKGCGRCRHWSRVEVGNSERVSIWDVCGRARQSSMSEGHFW